MTQRQPDLFAAPRAEPDSVVPGEEDVRARLHALLATVEAAERMPWPPARARTNDLVFFNMANWLPRDERDALRARFSAQMTRLRAGAPGGAK